MKNLNFYTLSFLALALSLISLQSYAGNIYRFIDKNGVSTLSKTLPPYVAQQGYEILDDKSLRVIERVPTQSEMIEQRNIAQQEQKKNQAKQKQQALKQRLLSQQQSADNNLLEIYPTIQDIINARDRHQAYISKQIEDNLAQNTYLQQTLHRLEQSAAAQELSGQTISETLSQSIKETQQNIVDSHLHIERLQNDKTINAQQYEKDFTRLKELQGITHSTKPTVPQN